MIASKGSGVVRRLLAVVAMVGVLVHAHALVRHALLLNDRALARSETSVDVELAAWAKELAPVLRADVSAICNPAHMGSQGQPTDHDGVASSCPICSGLSGAFILAEPGIVLLGRLVAQSFGPLPLPVLANQVPFYVPFARGPPSLA
jgi:hypothetical protein